MTFASSNRVALRVVEETTWGVTPENPVLEALRFTSEGVNYNADFITSEEIRADRMTPDTIQVSSSAGGPIDGELSFSTYDKLFAGGLYSDWVTTGSTVTDATDIAITKTPGSPNTWTLDSGTTDFSTQGYVVGQFVEVSGFTTAGTFYAEITTIAAGALGIRPTQDVASEIAGDEVTVTPLNFLINGVTKKSFTIQKEFTDLTVPEFWNFTGARVGSINFELATKSILKTTIDVLAKDADMTEAQFPGATITPANTNTVMNAVDNIASIVFDGDPGSNQFYFKELSLNIDNSLRGQDAVSYTGFIGVEAGRLAITGDIELYFENSMLFDRFRAAAVFSLSFVAKDPAGNTYIFTIPRAKYTRMEIAAGGLDQDIFATAEFEGLIDAGGTHQVRISRLAAA